MTLLDDVLDPVELAAAVGNGLVRAQRHPTLPFTIYNYTEACQYSAAWSPVTLACRGLIVDADGRIAARPLPKFFNHSESQAPAMRPDAAVLVTDKADGSLGVIYHDGAGWAVATRGSFASDQARHATELLRTRYASFTPPPGTTVLVEIIYPANRIVVDYRGLDDLVLLGAVDIATGRTSGPAAVPDWPGPVVETFGYATLTEALAAPPRDGREGLVVHFTETDQRVKIKYADYVRLHRLVTGLTPRTVWEILAAGGDLDALTAPLPDEFHTWVRGVAAELTATVEARAEAVEAAFAEIVAALPEGWGRKEFATAALRSEYRGELFLRLDGKDYRPGLWQRARPAA
ncbi:putative RNA ligase [Actinoplanes missouriensis 431]|uniref:Putative RNA ligase n=1 Tax=Actinoplanes missouriensis (strain ATCC 14538 / DSM 43046 / CBS 188.64 / JCM 3121 / NBRC 102363 / NCIMB 12654 / NRRL B-3342 / UNCC 431) TaxID=512565 RepID=I0HHE5_ACTM4|nr:RNA ligase [Actinoplanes missouriensis]BAL92432.1 putative RNA ligase [Actinoplanes missouriensis 431]